MDSRARKTTIRPLISIVLALIVLGGILYAFHTPLNNELVALKLVPIPQKFTELYVANYTSLPTQVYPGLMVPISFSIHNVEGKETTYPYVIYTVSTDGSTTTVATATTTIANNGVWTVSIPYTFITAATSTEFFIDLPDQNQDLHFKLPRTN
jgi:hypothetical protein